MVARAWILILPISACAAPATREWSWESWRTALLRDLSPGELPPLPSAGWRQAAPGVWARDDAEVSDYDGDGCVDYLRVVDPPSSYRHLIWVDLDHNGYFDEGPGIPEPAPRAGPRLRVPTFAP